jgi:hypothetical protein
MTQAKSAKEKPNAEKGGRSDSQDQVVSSIYFEERPGEDPYNASEVVPIGDSRFLFCDNNISEAAFEMRFSAEGVLYPLVRHPIRGVHPEAIDDLECMTMAEVGNQRLVFVSSSMCLKKGDVSAKKKSRRGKISAARESLIRVTLTSDGRSEAEIIPSFRAWLVENSPVLGKSANYIPDDGGLNIEGLGWDPTQSVLVFGLRTPVKDGRPLILRVRVKNALGIWNLSNLEMLPPLTLAIEHADGSLGIRSIQYDPTRNAYLVVIGNSISGAHMPFQLYSWDGNPEGICRRFKRLVFHKKMRPEGVCYGTIGGRGVILFVDDRGGYQYLWNDDPRLQLD